MESPGVLLQNAAKQDFHTHQSKKSRRCYSRNSSNAKFCWGKLKMWQFILLHIFVVFVLFSVILAPIFYFVIIPKLIRDKIRDLDLSQTVVQHLSIEGFHSTGFNTSLNAQFPPQFPFPISATLSPFKLKAYISGGFETVTDRHELVELDIPSITLSMHKNIVIDVVAPASLAHTDKEYLRIFLQKLSGNDGCAPFVAGVDSNVDISVFGIKFYRNFYIRKDIQFPALSSNIMSLLGETPSFLKPVKLNSEIGKIYPKNELLVISDALPYMKMHELDVQATRKGIEIKSRLTFENPIIVSMNIESLKFGILIEDVLVARIDTGPFIMKQGKNDLDLSVAISFEDPKIDKTTIPRIIEMLQGRLLRDDWNFKISIAGPIGLGASEKIFFATQHLALHLPVKELFQAMKWKTVMKLFEEDEIKKLVGNSELEFNIHSTNISIPFKIALPRFIPIPSIQIPFHMKLGMFREAQHVLDIMIDPVTLNVDRDAFYISTVVTIFPENSELASIAMAKIANPLLAATPLRSSLEVGNVRVYEKSFSGSLSKFERNYILPWNEKLFGDVKINIIVPVLLNVSSVIDLITNKERNLPFRINGLHVKQLESEPGFSLNGRISVMYPEGVPRLTLLLGYLGLSLNVNGQAFVDLEMPRGMRFSSDVSSVPVDSHAIFPPTDLSQNVQALVNGIFTDSNAAIGITGLSFGNDKISRFITFSRIVAEISTSDIEGIAKRAYENAKYTILQRDTLSVESLTMEVQSSTTLSVMASAILSNPVNISLSINPVELDLLISEETLLQVRTSPVSIGLGVHKFEIETRLGVSLGTPTLKHSIAQLVSAFMSNGEISTLSLTKFLILGNDRIKSIDQFKNVKVSIPSSMLLASEMSRFIDMSKVLPTRNMLSLIQPKISFINADIQKQMILDAGLNFMNPLFVSLRIPQIKFSLELQGDVFVTIDIEDISLIPGLNSIKPLISINFYDNEVNQEHVEHAINIISIDAWNDLALSVSGFKFGSSGELNSVFELIQVSLSSYIGHLRNFEIMTFTSSTLGFELPSTLSSALDIFKPSIGSFGVEMAESRSLRVAFDGQFSFGIPLDIKIDSTSVSAALQSIWISKFSINAMRLRSDKNGVIDFSVQVDTLFNDQDEKLRILLSENVQYFIHKRNFLSDISMIGFEIGSLRIFSKLNIKLNDMLNSAQNINLMRIIAEQTGISLPLTILDIHRSVNSLKKFELNTTDGKSLVAKVEGEMQLPFRVKLTIGYISFRLKLQGNPIISFTLEPLEVESNGLARFKVNSTLIFQDGVENQNMISELIQKVVSGNSISNTMLSIDLMTFGKVSAEAVHLFSSIDISSSLGYFVQADSFDHSAVINHVIGDAIAGHVAEMSDLDLVINEQKEIITKSLVVKFKKYIFPVTLNFGYFEFNNILIENNGLASLSCSDLSYNPHGIFSISQCIIKFNESDEVQTSLKNLVDSIMSRTSISSNIGLSGFSFGLSSDDKINLLGLTSVHAPVTSAQEIIDLAYMAIDQTSMNDIFSGKLAELTELNITVNERKEIQTNALKITLKSYILPISLRMGHFEVRKIFIDSHTLAKLSCSGLEYINGTTMISECTISLDESAETQDCLQHLLSKIIYYQMPSETIGLSQIAFGHSSSAVIRTFSSISVGLPVSNAIPYINFGVDAIKSLSYAEITSGELIEMNNLNISFNDRKELVANLLKISLKKYILPVSLKIGFFELEDVLIDSHTLMSFSCSGLEYFSNGEAVVSECVVRFNESIETQICLKQLAEKIISREILTGIISIGGTSFGHSDMTKVQTFSKISFDVPLSTASHILETSYKLVDEISLNDLTSGRIFEMNGLSIEFNEEKEMLSSSLKLTLKQYVLPISLKLGIFEVKDFYLGSDNLASLSCHDIEYTITGIVLMNRCVFKLNDSVETQATLDFFVSKIVQSQPISEKFGISQISFGLSQETSIRTFSLIKINAPMKKAMTLIESSFALINQISFEDIRSGRLAELNSFNLRFGEDKEILTSVMKLTLKKFVLPISIKMGYVEIGNILLNSNTLASLSCAGMEYTANGDASISECTIELNESLETEYSIKTLVHQVFHRQNITETVGINQFAFGYSKQSKINTFSKVSASAPISSAMPLINSGYKIVDTFYDDFLMKIKAYFNDFGKHTQKEVSFNFAEEFDVTIIDGQFLLDSNSTIGAELEIATRIPYSFSISIPYFGFSVSADYVPIFTIDIYGISVAPGENRVVIVSKIRIAESEALTSMFSQWATRILNGTFMSHSPTIQIYGINFGKIKDYAISTLSRAEIDFSIASIVKVVMDVTDTFRDPFKIIEMFDVNVKHLGFQTAIEKSIIADAVIGYNLRIPFAFTMEFFTFDVKIDDIHFVTINFQEVVVKKYGTDISPRVRISFPSSSQIKHKLASLVKSFMLDSNMEEINSKISISGLQISSNMKSINFLDSLKFEVNLKSLFSWALVSSLMKTVHLKLPDLKFIPKLVSMDSSTKDYILLAAMFQVANFPVNFDFSNGFLGLSILFQNNAMGMFKGTNMILHSKDYLLHGEVDAKLSFGSSEALRNNVSTALETFVENGKINALGGVQDFVFGFSEQDYIDSFSQIKIEHSLQELINAAINQVASKEVVDFTEIVEVKKFHFGIHAKNVFSLRVEASVLKEVMKIISVNIPYVAFQISVGADEFVRITVDDILIKNGETSGFIRIHLLENDNSAQAVLLYTTNLLFRRQHNSLPVFFTQNITFGSSESSNFNIASKYINKFDTSLNIDFVQAKFFSSPQDSCFRIENIMASVQNRTIDTDVEVRGFPKWIPFTTNISVMASIMYNLEKVPSDLSYTQKIIDVIIENIQTKPGRNVFFKLIIRPKSPDLFVKPFEHIFTKMASFENYATNALLGLPYFVEKNTHSNNFVSVNVLRRSRFQTPELYLWQPLLTSFSNGYRGDNGIKVNATITFPNPGPLNLYIGKFYGDLCEEDIVVKSVRNGGMIQGTNPSGLTVIITFTYDFFFKIVQNIKNKWREFRTQPWATIKRLFKLPKYDLHLKVTRNGNDVFWLKEPLEKLPSLIGRDRAILRGMIENLDIAMGPFKPMYSIRAALRVFKYIFRPKSSSSTTTESSEIDLEDNLTYDEFFEGDTENPVL